MPDIRLITDKERELIQMVADGKSYAEIGEKLSLSHRTVETYLAKIREKCGFENTIGMVAFFFRNKLIK